MKIFTKNPIQNVVRTITVTWVMVALVVALHSAYELLPVKPASSFLGIDLGEPNILAGFISLVLALALTLVITITPALMLWAALEDKFWPNKLTEL